MRLLLLIGMLLLAGIGFVNAKDHDKQLVSCVDDGEKLAVANKDCAQFKKSLGCAAEMKQGVEDEIPQVKRELAAAKAEDPNAPPRPGKHWTHTTAQRRQLFNSAARDFENALQKKEDAVATMASIIDRMHKEQHEAGCE